MLPSRQCQARLQWIDSPQCGNTARVTISGEGYCYLHAGIIALAVMDTRNNQPSSARCECTTHAPQSYLYLTAKEKKLREAEGWRCNRRAKINIDGVNMCYQHARLVALQHMVKNELASLLPYHGPYNPMCIISQDRASR
jgi:hypothetical protein